MTPPAIRPPAASRAECPLLSELSGWITEQIESEPVTLDLRGGRVAHIEYPDDGSPIVTYEEPERRAGGRPDDV